MKISEYLRSMSFLDLGPRSFTYENENLLFSEATQSHFQPIFVLAFRNNEIEINQYDAGHMTKMSAMHDHV